jgi:hypothetical protein
MSIQEKNDFTELLSIKAKVLQLRNSISLNKSMINEITNLMPVINESVLNNINKRVNELNAELLKEELNLYIMSLKMLIQISEIGEIDVEGIPPPLRRL